MDKLLRAQRILRETFVDVREWRVDMPGTLYGCLAMAMTYRARLKARDNPFLTEAARACTSIRAIIEEDNTL
jgi:hypothetical protein